MTDPRDRFTMFYFSQSNREAQIGLASRRRSMTLEIYAVASSTATSEALRRLEESFDGYVMR